MNVDKMILKAVDVLPRA
nr:hypothetical protein [Mesorhizobium sp. M1A.T.Ca.IN.004.03.1.1]